MSDFASVQLHRLPLVVAAPNADDLGEAFMQQCCGLFMIKLNKHTQFAFVSLYLEPTQQHQPPPPSLSRDELKGLADSGEARGRKLWRLSRELEADRPTRALGFCPNQEKDDSE